MRLRASIFVCLILSGALARAGEILDRIAASVNGHALLQSDVDEQLRYECFAAKRPLQSLTSQDWNAALDRLIDQELLRQQMRSVSFRPATADEVEKALQSFKSEYAGSDEESCTRALSTYAVAESYVRQHVENELNQLRLVDSRLRPSIQIDFNSIRTYYEQELVPKLPAGQTATLREVAPKIRELLTQRELNTALDSWLQSLRAQAEIQRFTSADEALTP
jgi:parvulin-like peptidyl-prolyl isomerase